MFRIKKLDHFVLTTVNRQELTAYYEKLGFTVHDGGNRCELFAGDFKINVHTLGGELSPHAEHVMPGSADFCFEICGEIETFKAALEEKGLISFLGVVERTGVRGKMKSIYLRDPDENLIEFCAYDD